MKPIPGFPNKEPELCLDDDEDDEDGDYHYDDGKLVEDGYRLRLLGEPTPPENPYRKGTIQTEQYLRRYEKSPIYSKSSLLVDNLQKASLRHKVMPDGTWKAEILFKSHPRSKVNAADIEYDYNEASLIADNILNYYCAWGTPESCIDLLGREYLGMKITGKKVSHARKSARNSTRSSSNSDTPFHELESSRKGLKLLENWNFQYKAHREKGEPFRLIFFVEEGLLTWRQFGNLMLVDTMFISNQYDLKLMQINAVSSTGAILTVAYVLSTHDKEDFVEWGLAEFKQQVEKLAKHHKRDAAEFYPKVVITSFDSVVRAAVDKVFGVPKQLCTWGLNQDIANLLRSKKWQKTPDITCSPTESRPRPRGRKRSHRQMGNSSDDNEVDSPGDDPIVYKGDQAARENFKAAWKRVCDAQTEPEFAQAWINLETRWRPSQPLIVDYLRKTYMPIARDWATVHTSRYRNFGYTSLMAPQIFRSEHKDALGCTKNDLHWTISELLKISNRRFETFYQNMCMHPALVEC